MTDTDEILDAVLKLTPAERAHRLEEIPTSLDGLDLGPAWEAEIRRRVADVDAGRVKTVSKTEVRTRLRRRLRRR